MARLGSKREFEQGQFGSAPYCSDGSQTANAALLKASLAVDRLERHEAECGRRWGIVMKLMYLVLTQLMAVFSFLIADKLGWLS